MSVASQFVRFRDISRRNQEKWKEKKRIAVMCAHNKRYEWNERTMVHLNGCIPCICWPKLMALCQFWNA